MTKRTPPRKPGRVRWWAWLLVATFVAYVGTYCAFRANGDLVTFTVRRGDVWPGNVLILDSAPLLRGEPAPWKREVFTPCAVVEELWLNR